MTQDETAYLVNLFQKAYLRRLRLNDTYDTNPVTLNYIAKVMADVQVDSIMHICLELGVDPERVRRAGVAAWQAHREELLEDWRRQINETY